MQDNQLVILSKEFAIDIINLCSNLEGKKNLSTIINQLLKSGTSIGANVFEANYAASRADFINKLQISLKECYESDYWLSIFKETKIISEEEYDLLFVKCSKLRKLLTSSITTAKKNVN